MGRPVERVSHHEARPGSVNGEAKQARSPGVEIDRARKSKCSVERRKRDLWEIETIREYLAGVREPIPDEVFPAGENRAIAEKRDDRAAGRVRHLDRQPPRTHEPEGHVCDVGGTVANR